MLLFEPEQTVLPRLNHIRSAWNETRPNAAQQAVVFTRLERLEHGASAVDRVGGMQLAPSQFCARID